MDKSQMNLFGQVSQPTLVVVEPKPKKPKTEQEEEVVEVEMDDWSAAEVRAVLDKKDEDGCDYHHLQLNRKSDLGGVKTWISPSHTRENPRGFMGSSWGGGGTLELKEAEIKEFFDELMEGKLDDQKHPYKKLTGELWKVDYHGGSDFYRHIPMKNQIVIISTACKDELKKHGFDFDAWNQEYMAIPENEATPVWDAEVDKVRETLEAGVALKKQSDVIRTSIRRKLGQEKTYSSVNRDNFPELGVDALMAKLQEIRSQLIKLNVIVVPIYQKIWPHMDDIISSDVLAYLV